MKFIVIFHIGLKAPECQATGITTEIPLQFISISQFLENNILNSNIVREI